LLPLFIITGAFLVIGAVLIGSGILPEERAREFRPLTDISIATDMKVIKEPTLEDNTFVYAINDIAQRGIDIAQGDSRVKQILDQSRAKEAAVTIAAVQPTVMTDRQSGKLLHSSAGQVIITANWQLVEGALYSQPKDPTEIANKRVESHQQIWNILVDVNKGQVTQIAQQADRVITDMARSNVVRADVNMFVPKAVMIEADNEIRWSNPSNLPHNVVGAFNQTTASDASNTTGIIPENSTNSNNNTDLESAGVIAIDSGFIEPNASWQYRFDKEGVFNYLCTIHAEEGMRGTIIITRSVSS
jgi:plastocyanin